MVRKIALVNQKGGVGKTTTAKFMALGLAARGYRVLAVDLDPQGNLSMGLGIDMPDQYAGIADDLLFCTQGKQKETGRIHIADNLDLCLGNDDLGSLDITLSGFSDGLFYLDNLLSAVKEEYDYILIDCMSSVGNLTKSALIAADELIIPTHPKFYGIKGIQTLLNSIGIIKARMNPRLSIAAVLPTQVDIRTRTGRKFVEVIHKLFQDFPVYDYIPASVKISATEEGFNPFDYDPHGAGVLAYQHFIDSYLEHSGGERSEKSAAEA